MIKIWAIKVWCSYKYMKHIYMNKYVYIYIYIFYCIKYCWEYNIPHSLPVASQNYTAVCCSTECTNNTKYYTCKQICIHKFLVIYARSFRLKTISIILDTSGNYIIYGFLLYIKGFLDGYTQIQIFLKLSIILKQYR